MLLVKILLLMIFVSSRTVIGRIRASNKLITMSGFPKRLSINPTLKSNEHKIEERNRVERCIRFIDSSPEPFHVVQTTADILLANGFIPLQEATIWSGKLRKAGKYFYTKNRSTIVAFTIGGKYEVGNGFKVIGAHTDSPNLKLKPRSKRSASGLAQLNVECYGGGLWYTWFDRDLSIAGRVIIRKKQDGLGTKFQHSLVRINRPVLRVPSLCIHLRTAEEREAFKVNKEDHLIPILCSEIDKSLSNKNSTSSSPESVVSEPSKTEPSTVGPSNVVDQADAEKPDVDLWVQEQQPELLDLLAEELKCDKADIADFELSLFDTQGAAISGAKAEFLCSSRLDNLASCFVAVEALVAHSADKNLSDDSDVSIVALFDHEEVGSDSSAGAGSPIMRDAVDRITNAMTPMGERDSEIFKAALSRCLTGLTEVLPNLVTADIPLLHSLCSQVGSFILSVDMAHAVHPNYAAKHEKGHSPQMNAGIVIKSNSNQRYASNGVTSFIAREIGRRAGVPVQEFAVRNDCPCGSTIGPILSQNTGMRAVDLGMPQLSMHSIREMMGCADLTFAFRFFMKFLGEFRSIDSALTVDDNFD